MSARIGRRLCRRLTIGLVLFAGVPGLEGCGDSDGTAEQLAGMDIIEPGLVVSALLHQRSEWTVSDSFALFRAADLALVEDGILVGDSGNDRLVLFDEQLAPIRTIGRSGAGPGELSKPFRIRVGHGLIIASELGNSRFSLYREDGSFSRVVRRDGMEGVFDLTSDSTLYRASVADGHYLLRIGRDGDTVSVAAIPPAVRALRKRGAPRPRWRSDLVVVTEGDTLHVFDNEVGALVKFDPAGHPHDMRTLPEAFRQAVIERSERLYESLTSAGHRVISSPLAGHLSVTSEGDLFLGVKSERIVGLIIDPHSYAVRYLRIPDDTGEWAQASNRLAAAVRDSTLFVVGMKGLASFRLREERRRAGR